MIENQGKSLSARVRGEALSGEVKCELMPTGEDGVLHAKIWGKQKNRCSGPEWDQCWFEEDTR